MQTYLIEAPPFLEGSEGSATLMVIVLNITVAVSCLPISSYSYNALSQKRTWTPDLPLYTRQGIAPVAPLGGQRIEHLLVLVGSFFFISSGGVVCLRCSRRRLSQS